MFVFKHKNKHGGIVMKNGQQKQPPIGQVIEDTEAYFAGMGYADSTLKRYRYIWRRFTEYARRKCIEELTVSLCRDFMRDEYGFEMYSIGLSPSKSLVRRPLLALLEFQEHRFVSRRCSMKDPLGNSFPTEFAGIAESFMEDLERSPLADITVKYIRYHLLSFFRHMIQKGIRDLDSIDINAINQYAIYLKGYSKSYIYSFLSAVRKLLKYALSIGAITTDITNCFPVITMPSRLDMPTVYSEEEISAILATVDRGSPIGKRNYAMLLLGIHYGLRSSDVCELKLSGLSFEDSKISLTQQKTGKETTFDILPDVGWALIDYLRDGRPKIKNDYVFISHRAPFSRFAENNHLWQIINKHLRMAGIERDKRYRGNGFHSLRHSLAGNMLTHNIPLTTIKEVLGHENLYTTTVYTKVDIPQLSLCALEVPQ